MTIKDSTEYVRGVHAARARARVDGPRKVIILWRLQLVQEVHLFPLPEIKPTAE